MRQVPQSPDGCNEFERVLLGDLELTQKYMQRVMGKSQDQRLTEPGLSCAVPFVDGGDPEPVAGLFSHLEATP